MTTKRVIMYGVLLGAMLIVLLSFLGVMLMQANEQPKEREATEDVVFVVGEWNGHLAVFEEGAAKPSKLYEDVWIVSFPPEEQERLANGIRVTSQAELNGVLEDYTS